MDDFKNMQKGEWVEIEEKELTVPYRHLLLKNYNLPATGTEGLVCDDIAKRQQLGINKYGTTVCANPLELREWLQHAYEECLDQAIYLKRALQGIDKKTS
jgi:hypothetical protein